MKHINIEQFSNGELTQQINREMEAVARNIADPNTEAKTARKITVTITMKPNEQRDFITGTDAWSCDCSRHPEGPEERRNRSGRNRKSDSRADVYGRCGSTTAGRTGA